MNSKYLNKRKSKFIYAEINVTLVQKYLDPVRPFNSRHG